MPTTASPELDLTSLIADTEAEIVRLVQDRDAWVLLCIDLWEHAYCGRAPAGREMVERIYGDSEEYGGRAFFRSTASDYVSALLHHVVDWDVVEERAAGAIPF